MTMSDTTPLLQLRGITKTFGSVEALTDVDFEVRAGEVMALVGDNGAGKSTLIKCVAGTHAYDSGQILFEGREVSIHGPKDAARLGIEVVYQDLALCDNLDVVQNMFLGREVHDRLQRLKEPTLALPVVWITKANYTRLFTDQFLKKSDVCVGTFKQYCK